MALCTRTPATVSLRASARAPVARISVRPVSRVVVFAEPKKSAVETAIKEAESACADPKNQEGCAAAWDAVEEISAAAADKKQAAKETSDPLEQYCKDAPDADECRVYE